MKEERTYYSTQPWSAAPPSARIQGESPESDAPGISSLGVVEAASLSC